MRIETIEALDALFERLPIMKAGPVSRAEVQKAFSRFRLPAAGDYQTFVESYGGAIVGPYRVFGLRRAPAMGANEGSALEVTERFVKQGWPGVENWLVISMDHSGNPIGLAADGQVWISDHDNGQVVVIAPSFETFLRQWGLTLAQ